MFAAAEKNRATSFGSALSITPASNKDESEYVSPADIMGVPQVHQTEPRNRGIKRGKTVNIYEYSLAKGNAMGYCYCKMKDAYHQGPAVWCQTRELEGTK